MDLEREAFHRGIGVLEQLGDQELLNAFREYVARLEATVGAGWLDTYAAMYQRDRRQLTGQAAGSLVLPEEIALRDRAAADPTVDEAYKRFIALLERKKLLDEYYVS